MVYSGSYIDGWKEGRVALLESLIKMLGDHHLLDKEGEK